MSASPESLTIRRVRSEGTVDCEECSRVGLPCTRERARQHARDKNHTVRYVVEDTTIYERAGGESQ